MSGERSDSRGHVTVNIPPPIDIPGAQRNALPSSDTLRAFVGSPEQLADGSDEPTPRPRPLTSLVMPVSGYFRARPSFPQSASTPYAPRRRGASVTTEASMHSRREPPSEREWSIFEDLMPSDGMSASWRSDRRFHIPPIILSASATSSRPSSRASGVHSIANSVRSSVYQPTLLATNEPVVEEPEASPSATSSQHDIEDPPEPETDDDESENLPVVVEPAKRSWMSLPSLTPLQRNILKCSVAYFIGSLFTFSPYLSGFISDLTSYGPSDRERAPSPSGHMVATVAVYYNPAKTMGAMLEADFFCFMGLLYVAFVSLASMSLFWFFEVQSGWEWLADFLLLFWIGLAMSAVAWLKVWMAKPTFNTACSMIAIIIFIVVVKEGGLETFTQVATIVFIGATVSNIVCYSLWPQRATQNLQTTMVKTLDSFSTLMNMITQTFLLEENVKKPGQEKLRLAIDSHQASFTALKKNLAEAQSEGWFGGPSKPSAKRSRTSSGQAYEDAIDSLTRLGQHLNGLRSGTSLQYELIEANKQGRLVLRNKSRKRTKGTQDISKSQTSDYYGEDGQFPSEDDILLQAAADMFGELLDDLGPPLKALSSVCTTSLKRLREAFVIPDNINNRHSTIEPQDFRDLANAIERALFTFESTSNHAILRLYRSGTADSSPSFTPNGDENIMGSQSENIFLVYFFIFTLQEFAKELISLVDAMSRICNIRRLEAEKRGWWHNLTARVARFRVKFTQMNFRRPHRRQRAADLRKRLSGMFVPLAHKAVSFPKVKPHAPNTIQTPSRQNLTFWGKVKQSIWALGARLKEQDLKYAIKAGMATAILAAPAFVESTRPTFVEYRGEWALISFFVVISPTIGATNFLGIHRVLGTMSGAATAAAVWTAFPENPYVLSVFGFFFSMPCFYYIVAKPQFATSARFVLLTYNLTCLYCYNSRQEDISVVEIASHRFVAVTVGVVWAAIVSRYWWPAEARRELSKALGEFCLNVGWLYTRLVAFNSFDSETGYPHLEEDVESSTPLNEATSLLTPSANSHLNDGVAEFMAMELHLQIKLIELQGLLAQTQHEPRLKGPFPIVLYRSMLTSLQTILDRLHSMRCVTSREEWHTTVRKEFIIPVNKERRDMVGNIILYFSVLASAFRLKSPLPPYLPPAEESRRRLVDAIRRLDVTRNRDVHGSRQLLFFAYALTMQGITHELDYLGSTLQEAFGVIGGSTEEFETMFRDTLERAV